MFENVINTPKLVFDNDNYNYFVMSSFQFYNNIYYYYYIIVCVHVCNDMCVFIDVILTMDFTYISAEMLLVVK